MHIVFTLANNTTAPYFKWFAELAHKKQSHRFSFVVMHTEKPKMIEDVAKFGWKCYWIKYDSNKRKRGMIRVFFRCIRLFYTIKPDIVHSHLFDDSVPALFAAKILKVKIRAITKGDCAYHYNYAKKWVKFDKFNNKNATAVIAPSSEAYSFIKEKEKCKIEKLFLIHTCIPVDYFGRFDSNKLNEFKSKYIKNKAFIVGTMARFIEWKGYETVVKVAKIIINKYPDIYFLLMGEGPQKKEIQKEVKLHHLDNNIIFGGIVENQYLPSFYPVFDVFLHAAYMEPGGFVLMESMAAGLPVVTTPTGAIKDVVVNRINGWIGEYGNEKSLAEGIEYFYLNKNPKPWKAAQDTAKKHFDFPQMYDSYIKLYETQYLL